MSDADLRSFRDRLHLLVICCGTAHSHTSRRGAAASLQVPVQQVDLLGQPPTAEEEAMALLSTCMLTLPSRTCS